MENFDRQKIQAIVKVIRQLVRCPRCQGSFSEHDVELVAGMGMTYFVKLSCSSCSLGVMASLVQMDQSKKKVNSRVAHFSNDDIDPINTDDLIDIHDMMKEFDGNFKALLKK